MIIIDATNTILGRLASYVAQKAILGEEVQVINCENAVVTGNKKATLRDYNERLQMGSRTRGPFTPTRADRFVKRTIRGMLPYKKENGTNAFKRIRCYIRVPEGIDSKKVEHLNNKMDFSKLTVVKYITVKDICNNIGAK